MSLQILVPWWQRSWGSIDWYYAFLVNWKSWDVNHFFGDCEFWTWDNLVSPLPSINTLDPLGGSNLPRNLSLNSSSVVLPTRHVSFSPLHQMEKRKVERIVVESWLFGSLVSAVCQLLWWACHDISVIVTGLHCQGLLLDGALRLEPMI